MGVRDRMDRLKQIAQSTMTPEEKATAVKKEFAGHPASSSSPSSSVPVTEPTAKTVELDPTKEEQQKLTVELNKKPVIVQWYDVKQGKVKNSHTGVGGFSRVQKDLSNSEGPYGSILNVYEETPSGTRGRKLASAPSGTLESLIAERDIAIRKAVKHTTTPEEVKFLGFETEYKGYLNEFYRNEITEPKFVEKVSKKINQMSTPAFAKKFYTFNDKTWEQVKQEEPALEVRKTSSGFETYLDIEKWQSENAPKVAPGGLGGWDTTSYQFSKEYSKIMMPVTDFIDWFSASQRGDFETQKEIERQSQYIYTTAYNKKNVGLIAARSIGSVPGILGMSYGLGAGIGALKTAIPVAGQTAEIGLVGYGGLSAGKTIISGSMEEKKALAFTLPLAVVGYGAGSRAGGLTASSFMESRSIKPITYGSGFYSKINPVRFVRNQWVKFKAEKVENYVDPLVESGIKNFPEAHPSQTYRNFLKGYDETVLGYRVVHGTGEKFIETGVPLKAPSRGTDVYGLYVTPKGHASSYFTRIPDNIYEPSFTEFTVLPKIYRPSFRELVVESIGKAPKNVRGNINLFKRWQLSDLGQSRVTITPAHYSMLKMESEGVIDPLAMFAKVKPTGLIGRIKGYSRYTVVEGRNVPIYEYLVGDVGTRPSPVLNTILKQSISNEAYYNSLSSKISSYSLFSPVTVSIGSAFSSIRSNLKSNFNSIVSSRKTSTRSSIVSNIQSSILSSVKSSRSNIKSSQSGISSGSYSSSIKSSVYSPIISSASIKSYMNKIIRPIPPSKFSYPKDILSIKKKRKKKKGKKRRLGYRIRYWDMPSVEDIFKIGGL